MRWVVADERGRELHVAFDPWTALRVARAYGAPHVLAFSIDDPGRCVEWLLLR